MENEVWKDIEGFEGLYQISNLGRVKSLSRSVVLRSGLRVTKEIILKEYIAKNGYYSAVLSNKGHTKLLLIHRLLAIAFLPKVDDKNCINHKDGNKLNNALENLEWCTKRENLHHAWKTGLKWTKLTEDNVREIKSMSQKPVDEIAEKFKVNRMTIYAIRWGQTWKHIA